jgi:hypothetical protein
MKLFIRLPYEREITVEIDESLTIAILKEMICQQEHLQINRFTLYDQVQSLADSIRLSTLSSPHLYLIHDTLDVSKILHGVTKHPMIDDSLTIEELVKKPTIHIYPSSAFPKPIIPSVPKASFRKKPSQQYDDEDDDGCVLL